MYRLILFASHLPCNFIKYLLMEYTSHLHHMFTVFSFLCDLFAPIDVGFQFEALRQELPQLIILSPIFDTQLAFIILSPVLEKTSSVHHFEPCI